MIQLFIIISFLVSALIARVLVPKISLISMKKKLFDLPNERTVHHTPVPRLGGVSFFPTIVFSMAFTLALRIMLGYPVSELLAHSMSVELLLLLCGLTLLYLTGVADDLVGVAYKKKFWVQLICASFFPLSGIYINHFYGLFGLEVIPYWIGMPFTIVLCVFITNAINLIDGIDGLATSLSGVAATVFGLLFYQQGLYTYSMLSFSVVGVLTSFFYFNVWGRTEASTKIFMGDTGSLTLGYIFSFLAVKYAMYDPAIVTLNTGAILVAFSTLLVPCLDVIRVMLVRLRNGNHPFKPDRNHIHHKFLAMGVGHRRTMCLILLIATLFCLSNIILINYININILFVADIAIWTVMHLIFDRIRDQHQATITKEK